MTGLKFMNKLILKFKKHKNYALPTLSGLLLILFPLFDFNYLIWFSLIPLFLFIFSKSTTTKETFWGGLMVGAIFGGGLLGWLFDTYPFEFLGLKNEKEIALTFIIFIILWILHILFIGLFIGAFSWTIKKLLYLKISTLWFIFLIPGIWIIFEYLRAWTFNLLWLGKETFWSPYWTWGNLAYFLHNNSSLSQIADIGGIYLVSFLIVLINVLLFLIIYKFKQKTTSTKHFALMIIFILFVLSAWKCYGLYRLNLPDKGKTIKLALLQTNFMPGSGLNAYNKQESFDAVRQILQNPKNINHNPDIIVEPEGFSIVAMSGNQKIAKYILKNFWQPEQIYIENQKITDLDQKTTSRLFYYDLDKKESIAFSDKNFLMPNGEYLPYITKLLLNLYSFNINTDLIFFSRGDSRVAETPKGKIGGTICTGFMSSNINRQMSKNGAEILLSVASDAPFHGSQILSSQILAMTKFRAIENRRYFGQSANMGYSFLINSKGRIVNQFSIIKTDILFANAKLLNTTTAYMVFGDWIIFAVIVVLLLFFIFRHAKNMV